LQLRDMLQRLADGGVETVVLTFNSSHTVQKALGPSPGCGLLALLRGAKTNADTIIGCEDYAAAEKSNFSGRLREPMPVKSLAINARWRNGVGALPAERVLFVDDDKRNIAEVRANSGVCCHQVVEARGGMSEADCTAVLAWLDVLPPQPPSTAHE
jgi:hypothetical protein